LLQGLGALLVLTGASIGAAVTLRQIRVSQGQLQATREQLQHTVEATRLQLKLTEQGQITDRYTRAIDQLGSQHLDIRLGGIYALERIARDSPDDRTTIEEVLTGYVRGHAPWPPPAAPTSPQAITQRLVTFARRRRSVWQRRPAEDTAGQAQQGRLDEKGAEPQGPAADVQAVMTVLTRRLRPSGVQHISQSLDLSRVDLRYTYLERANLQGANLNGANLQGASLIGADLQGASLDGANLQGVQFYTANLQDAQLYGANLQGAYLQGTNLQGANLDGAYLFGAFLIGANLQGASLDGAYLQGAYLDGANLQGAKLGIPNPAVHLQNARADEDTRWPAGWNRARAEAHGVRYLSKPLTFPPGQGRPSSAVHGSTDQME
jgi:uncharacterized protein YjbI with pentapeptide repeats